MADEAIAAKRARRLAESSVKTRLETGKFDPGFLSEKVGHTREIYERGDIGSTNMCSDEGICCSCMESFRSSVSDVVPNSDAPGRMVVESGMFFSG